MRTSSVTSKLLLAAICCVFLIPRANAELILPPGATWEYTFTDPTIIEPTWNTTTGLGGIWSSGAAPFSNVGSGDFAFNTFWPADDPIDGDDDLWVRLALDLTGYDLSTVRWDLGVDNGFKLYANGVLVGADNAEGFTSRWEYPDGTFLAALTPGVNVIAVALEDHGGLTAFDMQIRGDRVAAVPEPASGILLALGAVGLAGYARRRALQAVAR